MAKFVVTSKPPKEEKLDKDCIVIEQPNFMDEVIKAERKRPRNKVMSVNYLREIISQIGERYADENFNTLTSVNVSPYRGVPCETLDQAHDVVVKVFRSSYPQMFDLYVDHHIKKRPRGTKLIYFTGSRDQTNKFFEHGIDEIKEKEVPVHLGLKKKKVVGKPAITNEEAALNN